MTPTHIAKQTQTKGGQWRCIKGQTAAWAAEDVRKMLLKNELAALVLMGFQAQNTRKT
ncbi:MAG: hypothetical protein PHT57_17145 [Rhodoferax sp.]|nr:hypothetical protein [Rhodoferax sp.]